MTTQVYIEFDTKGATPLAVINILETTLREEKRVGKIRRYLIATPQFQEGQDLDLDILAIAEEEG